MNRLLHHAYTPHTTLDKALPEFLNCKFTVLIADDSANDHFFVHRSLVRSSCLKPVGLVSDGEQVRDYLMGKGKFSDRELYPFPDLLVLDLDMPGWNGLKVLEWLQSQNFHNLRVVVLSGTEDREKMRAALALGADFFQAKNSDQKVMGTFVHRLELLMLLLRTRNQAAEKQIGFLSKNTVAVLDCRDTNNLESRLQEALRGRLNFLIVLQQEEDLAKISSYLGLSQTPPDRLRRWGIQAMMEALTELDFNFLLGVQATHPVYLIQQLNLPGNTPPKRRNYIVYCELRGIISEHDLAGEARESLLNHLERVQGTHFLPLAAVYAHTGNCWVRVKTDSACRRLNSQSAETFPTS
jgi:CheY-like chemotaxis protein